MLKIRHFRSRGLAWVALAAFVTLVGPAAISARAQTAPAAGNGSLVGFVYGQDMKTPVTNAVVKVRNLVNGTEYASGPSDAEGMYTIAAIAAGKYVMGVTAGAKDYNFEYAVALKDNEMAKLSVALKPASAQEEGTTEEGTEKKSFFKSPAGIVTLVVVAGGIIYALTAEKEASPVIK